MVTTRPLCRPKLETGCHNPKAIQETARPQRAALWGQPSNSFPGKGAALGGRPGKLIPRRGLEMVVLTGIYAHVVFPDLEVKVNACAVTGSAGRSNVLAAEHLLPH